MVHRSLTSVSQSLCTTLCRTPSYAHPLLLPHAQPCRLLCRSLNSTTVSQSAPLSYAQIYNLTHPLLLPHPQSRSPHSLTPRHTVSPTLFSYLIHHLAACCATLLRPDIQSHPPSSLTSSTVLQSAPLSYAQTYSLTHPLFLPHPQSRSPHHSLTPRHTVSSTLFSYLIHNLAACCATLLRPDIQYHPPSSLTSSTVSQSAPLSYAQTYSITHPLFLPHPQSRSPHTAPHLALHRQPGLQTLVPQGSSYSMSDRRQITQM